MPTPKHTDMDENGDAAVDVTVLKNMFGDDDDLVREIFGEFSEPAEETDAILRASMQAGDLVKVGNEAHKLKSSCLAIGAMKLGELCKALEFAAKGEDVAKVESLKEPYVAAYAAAKKFITKY